MHRFVLAVVAGLAMATAAAPSAGAAATPSGRHNVVPPPSRDPPPADPVALIARIYRGISPPEGEGGWAPPDSIYTPHLASLFALERRETPRGDVGRLDFAFWIDGNDGESKDLKITAYDNPEAPGRRIVTAKFTSFGERKELHFYFERIRHRWLLDEVRLIGGRGWTLSTILKYGEDFYDAQPGSGS